MSTRTVTQIGYYVQGRASDEEEWYDVGIWDEVDGWTGTPSHGKAQDELEKLREAKEEMEDEMYWDEFRIVKRTTYEEVVTP